MVMECKVTARKSHYPKEGPWELPEGWAWCRLDELGEVITGTTPSKGDTSNYGNDYPFYKPTDLENGINTTLAGDNLSAEGYEKARKLPINSVLVTCIGATIGKTGLIRRAGSCNQQINAVIPLPFVVPEYLYYCCVSGYGQDAIISNASATTLPILNKSRFSELLFPLPPIQEQQRILEAINHYMAIIEGVDDKRIKLIKLSDASKTKILDLAIHGKLVPQDHSDEPAIELLKRINPNFKPSDNLHYEGDLPNGWQAVNLGQVVDIVSGTSYPKSDIVSSGEGIRILRGGNIQNGRILLFDDDVYVQRYLANERNALRYGDIVIVASTGSHELIGKAAQVDTSYSNTQIGAFLRIIRPKVFELADYLSIIFQSGYYKNHIRDVAKGTNINNIKSAYLTDFIVPIPPLEEQRRILQRINALFVIVDQITDSINDTKQVLDGLDNS